MKDALLLSLDTASISEIPTNKLREELANGLTLTAQVLTRLGWIWAELEKRGEDLAELKAGLARTLPLIASGRLAAEAVVAFAGRPLVLRCLEGLPLDEQRRLADGEPIPVYLDGETLPQSLPLIRIPSNVITRVLFNGLVRTPAEQRLAMRTSRKTKKKDNKINVIANHDARTIRVGTKTVPVESVVSALVECAGGNVEVVETKDRPARTIAGKVTDEEKERIMAAAKAHGLNESELVRRAVLAMWLL